MSVKDDMIKTLNYFITRDLVYIIGGGSVIAAFLYYFGRLPTEHTPTPFYILGTGVAYVVAYALQDLACFTTFVTTRDIVIPGIVLRWLYKQYEGREWPVPVNFQETYFQFLKSAPEPIIADFQRIVMLRLIGTAIGPSFLASSVMLYLKYRTSGDSFDDWLAGTIAFLGFGLWLLGWLKGAQQTQRLYAWCLASKCDVPLGIQATLNCGSGLINSTLEEPTMPRKRYTKEQIIAILAEATAGAKTLDLCRKHGVSENTFYKWRSKYAGMTVPDIKKMRSLEDENARAVHAAPHPTNSSLNPDAPPGGGASG